MLINYEETGMITVVRAASWRMTSADLVSLKQAHAQMLHRGQVAMLLDLSEIRRIARSGLAALVEFASCFQPGTRLGLFGAQGAVASVLADCPLTAGIPIFATRQQALQDPDFQSLHLTGLKAVVLCAGAGSRMAPLTETLPKPMLDVFGKPILEHILTHLQSYGIRDFLLNPGHNAERIHEQFATNGHRSLFFLNEGHKQDGSWVADPLGSASTLARLRHRHNAFSDDFLVLCGDAIIDLDVADLIARHRNSGAEVTIAASEVAREETSKYGIIEADETGRVTGFQEKPVPAEARSTLASTGIYVFSPRALDHFADCNGLDIASDLLPSILERGGRISVHAPGFNWIDFGCGRDYYDALAGALTGDISGLAPEVQQLRPGLWVHDSAYVGRRADISGSCYIGPGAVIENGARVEGPTVIGANAQVKKRSLVRRSVICADTTIQSGTWVEDLIVHTDWAVNHRFADGRKQVREPLEVMTPQTAASNSTVSWFSRLSGAVS